MSWKGGGPPQPWPMMGKGGFPGLPMMGKGMPGMGPPPMGAPPPMLGKGGPCPFPMPFPRPPGLTAPGPGPPNGAPPPPGPIKTSSSGIPADTIDQYKHLREDMIKLEEAANEAEKKGEDATFKMMLLQDVNEKVRELEEKHPGIDKAEIKEVEPPKEPDQPSQQQMQAPLTITQQQALLYEQQKAQSNVMEPEVLEFQEQYGLQDRHAWLLNEALKKRNDTFDDDLWYLHEIMKACNNTAQCADLLRKNLRWMAEGVFCGAYSPNPMVIKAAKKFKLDPPSACKLADALEKRQDPELDMENLNLHLERSSKPSSLVMIMLKTLSSGGAIEPPTKPPAIGSWLHKEESKRDMDKRDRRSRSRGGRGGRDRSRERRQRSRSNRRGRSRDRDRDGGGGGGGGGGRRDDRRRSRSRDNRRRGDSRERRPEGRQGDDGGGA